MPLPPPPPLPASLRERLACPRCPKPVRPLTPLDGALSCPSCGQVYPIEDGIPVLLPDPPPSSPAAGRPDGPDLSVLILAYNEADNLAHILPLVRAVLDDLACSYEIVVVDGGSKDATVERARENGGRVFRQEGPGYGSAFREGLAACSGAYILTLDSDMSHDPGFIRVLWRQREEADLLVGSRYVPGAEAEMSTFRRNLSLFMNGVFRRVLALPLLDLSSGFRLYRRRAVEGMALQGRDFDILVEVLVRLFNDGFRVREIPMYFKPRQVGQSNLRVARFGVSYGRLLVRLRRLRLEPAAADHEFRAFHSPFPRERQRQHEQLRTVRALLGSSTDDILHVGCGSSKLLQSLPEAVGLDVRIARLRFMRQTNDRLVAGNVQSLPFRDGSFATVICLGLLPSLPDPRPAILEMARVLRREGQLIVGMRRPDDLPLEGTGLAFLDLRRVSTDEWLGVARKVD